MSFARLSKKRRNKKTMIYKINNGNIYLSVDTMGAEMRSLCDVHGLEYLWQGQKGVWEGQAPILFPIVGAQKDGQYFYNGKTYEIGNHGFAAAQNFKLLQKYSDKLVLSLSENEETLRQYPFKFQFTIGYELSGDTLTVRFRVQNHDDKDLPFAVGGHPGFRVPLEDDEEFSDYALKFPFRENCNSPRLKRNEVTEPQDSLPVLQNSDTLPLSHGLFSNGVLILRHLVSRSVSLYSKNSGRGVRVDFEGFDNLGLWQMNNGNFLCIEPWSSPGTHSAASGLLTERAGITLLPPEETAEYSFSVTII